METVASAATAEALAARRYLYKVFNRVFGTPPSNETAAALDAGLVAQAFDLALGPSPLDAAEFMGWLVRDDVDYAAMTGLYNALFVGPAMPAALPWEVMYVTNDKRLFGPVALEVRKAYRTQGMLPQGYPHVSDDALWLELDFMYLLGERALERVDQPELCASALAASRAFLDEHLLRWVDRCVANVRAYREGTFYAAAARALAAFVRADRALLDELLK